MITATLLITTSMLASALTAATGVGGGTLLLLVMAWVLPLPVAIPLHSAVQLFSNGSRAWLIREHIRHKIVVPMLIGGCFGAVIGAPLIFSETVTNWLPVIFGALVLAVVWLPLPAINHLRPPALLCLGFFINGIGSLISAIGPITASTLRTQMDNKLQTVATLAAIVCGFGTESAPIKKAPQMRGFFVIDVATSPYCVTLTTTLPESSISKRSASITLVQALAKILDKPLSTLVKRVEFHH
jgi:uncharacterized membrane protein YfcA